MAISGGADGAQPGGSAQELSNATIPTVNDWQWLNGGNEIIGASRTISDTVDVYQSNNYDVRTNVSVNAAVDPSPRDGNISFSGVPWNGGPIKQRLTGKIVFSGGLQNALKNGRVTSITIKFYYGIRFWVNSAQDASVDFDFTRRSPRL